MDGYCAVTGNHRGTCKMIPSVIGMVCRKGRLAVSRQHFHSTKRVSKKRCNVKEMTIPFRSRLA